MYEANDAYGRPFAFLVDPRTHLHTVVLACAPADETPEGTTDAGWIAACERRLVGLPAGAVGATLVAEAFADAPTQLRTTIALTYPATAYGTQPRRTPSQLAVTLGALLPGLCASLQGAGVTTVPLTGRQVTVAVRNAYDPGAAALLDRSEPAAGPHWHDVAPLSSRDLWDHFRHDGACSVSWVASPPQGDHLPPQWGGALTPPPDQVAAQRLAFLYEPVTADGAGTLTPFAAVATATVRHVDDLRRAVAVKHGLTDAVRGRLRRAFGGQAGAFAAGLPLGVTAADGLSPRVFH
ncbi:MAG: hypothetical protein HOV68_01910 [Streptomycetaceae bacterium]|nr:hypothetical protein [Streptomycetaceae bacterium]